MIAHHPSETTLLAYAAGTLPEALAIVAATHIGGCHLCRHRLEALEAVGGVLLDSLPPAALSDDALDRLLARADEAAPAPPPVLNAGLPPPLDRVPLGRWWPIGLGARWRPLQAEGAAWGGLVLVQPGRALPRHGHDGLELTCVLKGAFSDGSGRYGPGDLSEPQDDHDLPPVAELGEPCLCVIASEGMRLRGLLGWGQRMIGL
nr:ChrR family anti-sigma-E factor [uncultured Rhodopila sp.]